MSLNSVGRDGLAYLATGVSGGGAATALSVANEIVQLIAGLVAIAAGIASLVHFLRKKK
jgi:hypothetical protein